MSTAFIDGDGLVYRCAFAAQKALYTVRNKQTKALIGEYNRAYDITEEDTETGEKTLIEAGYRDDLKRMGVDVKSVLVEKGWRLEDLSHALQALKSAYRHITETTQCDDVRIFISGKGNFRYDRATIMPYKGNRSDEDKPVYYNDVREHLIKHYDAEPVDGWEADDEIVYQYELGTDDSDVIVTVDKDLHQCSGKFYDWVKQEFIWVPVPQADRNFFKQVLTGDRVDNIPGIPGIGDKKAETILGPDNNFERMQTAVEEAYKYFYTEDEKGQAIAENMDMTWEDFLYEIEDLIRIGRPHE